MRASRIATALILVAAIVVGGLYLYNQTYGPICLQAGHLAIISAQLGSSASSYSAGTYEFSLCNGTNQTINWMGASINSQRFLSSGPEWIHAANGTSLEGLNSASVDLGQLLPSQRVCNFTFAGWAYDAGIVGTPGMVLSAGSDNSTATTGIVDVAYNDSQVYFQLSSLDFQFPQVGTESLVRNTGYVPGAFRDRWTFLAIVLDNGQTRGYVNGTEAWVGRNVGCTTLKTYAFGGEQFNPFNGVIRNVSFYDTALSSTETKELYSGQPVSSGLEGYWRVNDGHGCTVQDSSGNSRNGTIQSCISVAPGGTFVSNPVSGQNQPLALPPTISNLTSGERVTLAITVEFSNGSTSQVSTAVIVQ